MDLSGVKQGAPVRGFLEFAVIVSRLGAWASDGRIREQRFRFKPSDAVQRMPSEATRHLPFLLFVDILYRS